MAYQVLARKWRPQRFDEVVGQRGVTQTLRNAIRTGRIAQAFVFAGPRGVGKTTTARILARALNCEHGPTPDPCGTCEACVEIAEGRDMDVLELDAATYTGIDIVRAVIIEGLSILPVRDRYKIFIIDEVQRLSPQSFDALLKSIEEPPPHVAFIMATTEPQKIPDTITSRAQVYEFRTIPAAAIAEQLRTIADAEKLDVPIEALALVARAADGSMRDAQTALDQVIAFAGDTIRLEDVSSVLGLVGRDLLLDIITAVADENAGAAFELAGRAVEQGHDLKVVCRELARVVRDIMVLSIDPSRITDPDVAPEGERERLKALVPRFSREDLLRAFDVLTKAEFDVKNASEPRYHLEMAFLRWIHLRKLAPLAELIEQLQADPGAMRSGPPSSGRPPLPPRSGPPTRTPPAPSRVPPRIAAPPATRAEAAPQVARAEVVLVPEAPAAEPRRAAAADPEGARARFLSAIEQQRAVLYRTLVAQATRIDFDQDVVFEFAPIHRLLKEQVEQNKAWLESVAQQAAGRPVRVRAELLDANAGGPAPGPVKRTDGELRAAALADAGVQALLGVFPAEIRAVEELDPPRR